MSLQISYAKARYSGDPGIFGAIGKALGSIGKVAIGAVGGLLSGGPLGAITGAGKAVAGIISGGSVPVLRQPAGMGTSLMLPLSTSAISRISATSMPGTGQPGASVGLQLPGGGSIGFGGMAPSVGINAGAVGGVGYYAAPGTGMVKRGHLNKTGYFLKSGEYVAPGSKVVANRRMNPLNPQSLSKSIRRVSGFAHATKSIRSQISKVATQVAPKRTSCGGKCGTRKR